MFKQVHPRANISIECDTSNVPNDGKFYVIKDGKVITSSRSLKAAQSCYQKLVGEKALPPLVKQDIMLTSEQIQDAFYARISNNALLGTSFGSDKGKKTGRFKKTR